MWALAGSHTAAYGCTLLQRRGARTTCSNNASSWQNPARAGLPSPSGLLGWQSARHRTWLFRTKEHVSEHVTGGQHPHAAVSAYQDGQEVALVQAPASYPDLQATASSVQAAAAAARATAAATAGTRLPQQPAGQPVAANGYSNGNGHSYAAAAVHVLDRPEFAGASASDSMDYDMTDREFSSGSEDEMLSHGVMGTYGSSQERPAASGYAYSKANYEVVRLDSSGRSRKFYVRRRDLLKEFRLQPRDLRRIDPSIDFTKTSPSITIKENVLLLCLGGIKAIVTAEKALLFEPGNLATKRFLDTITPHLRGKQERSAQAARQAGADGAPTGAGGGIGVAALDSQNRQMAALSHTEYMARFYAKTEQGAVRSLPFELDVLEGALIGATGRLDAELSAVAGRVQELVQRLPGDINPVSLEELRRVKAALVELEDKADNMRELLEELMDDEDELRELNLSSRPRREERRRQRERDRLERELERAREIKEELEERLEEDEGHPGGPNNGGGMRSATRGGPGPSPASATAWQSRPWGDPGGWPRPNPGSPHSPSLPTGTGMQPGVGSAGGGMAPGPGPVNGYVSWSASVRMLGTDAAPPQTSQADARQQRLAELRAKFDRQRLAELRSKFSWGVQGGSTAGPGQQQGAGMAAGSRSGVSARDSGGSGSRRSGGSGGSSGSARERDRERDAERADRLERLRAARGASDAGDGDWISRLEQQLEGSEEDIQEAQEALEEMVEAEEEEAETEETEDLLEYYLQRVSATQSEAERLLEGARDLEESIGVSLSARRYEVNRLELTLSIGSFAAAIGAMVAGIFGMNMRSCLEMSVGGFWGITGLIVVGCVWVFWAIMRYTRAKRIL